VIAFIEGFALQFYRFRGKLLPLPDLLRHIIRGALLIGRHLQFCTLSSISISPRFSAPALW